MKQKIIIVLLISQIHNLKIYGHMIGGSINNALAVKNNESNIQDTLDWMQQQRIHKMKLKQFKRDLMDQKIKVQQSKFGGKKCKDIDSQMALRNQNVRVTSLSKQNQDKKETMRKNLILNNKIKSIFNRRQSYYGELYIGSSSKLLSASPTTKGHSAHNSTNRIKQNGMNKTIMLNQCSGVELQYEQQQQQQPTMKIQEDQQQEQLQAINEQDQKEPGQQQKMVYNPSFDGSSGHLMANSGQKEAKEPNAGENENSKEQSKTELAREGEKQQVAPVNDYGSMEKEQETFGAENRKNNLTALTPMNLNNNLKVNEDINSMETDLNQLGLKNQKDLLMTHQVAFNSGKKNMGSTAYDLAGRMQKLQANFNKEANSNMLKTQTSFQSQTTYPHLYVEVQRPSFLHTLNSGGKVGEPSEQTYFNMLNSGLTSKMSVKQPFHNRHKSLNETIRRHEQIRIHQENNKMFRQMKQMRPSSALQVEKLAKHFKKNQHLKKNIVMTKYSKRHQTQLKQAIRIRQKVFEDLPPVISPLYRPGMPRRRSSEIDLKQMSKTENKFNDSSQKIQLEKIPQGSVTARAEPTEENSPKEDKEKSGETNDKPTNDDSKMLMNHDESVQNVLYNTTTGFRQRHKSLGPQKKPKLDDLSPEQYYVQEEMKYLYQVDPHQYNNPYNFRMDIYSQQQDYKMSRQLYKLLGNSKYHKDLDLQQFTSGQLPSYNIESTMTPQMLQSYYSNKKVTNQDLSRRKFYGNLINQVSTRDIIPKTSLNYQSSGNNYQVNAGSSANQMMTQSNFNKSSNSINNEQHQSQTHEPPEIVSGNLPTAGPSLAPKQSSNLRNISHRKTKTIGYNLPSITNTYGLYQQLMSEEIDELKRMQEAQKLEGFRIKQQLIMKKEKKKLEDIKKYKIAMIQREKDQKLAQLAEAAAKGGMDRNNSGNNVKVVDQNDMKDKQDKKPPPRIPNQTTISWVNKMRTSEAIEAGKEKNQQRTFADVIKQEQQKNTGAQAPKSQRDDSKKKNQKSDKKSPRSLTRQNQGSPAKKDLTPNNQNSKIKLNAGQRKSEAASLDKNQGAQPNAKRVQIKKDAMPNISKINKADQSKPSQHSGSRKPSGPSTNSNKASVSQASKPQQQPAKPTPQKNATQAATKPQAQAQNKLPVTAANQHNMNQTMTSLSSNIVKGTINSQTATPNLQMRNLPGDKKPADAAGQSQIAVPKAATNPPSSKNISGVPSAEQSIDDEEEDLTQRKKLNLDTGKSKGSKKGDDLDHITDRNKDLNNLEEKGHETTDNYDDYNESEDEKKDTTKNLHKTVEKVKKSSESSQMVDSHAKNSEEYESDFFDENAQQPKNAHDYFKEEEARKSRNTPVGGNPNSDGGSVFNQTGGQFLSRGQFNQTKSSIYKQENNVAPVKRQDSLANKYNQKPVNDDQQKGDQNQLQKAKEQNAKLKQEWVNSTSRYNPYEEAQEGQYAKALADYSMSPPFIRAKEQALSGHSSKGSFVQPSSVMQGPSRNNLDDRGLGPNTATFPGQGSKDKASFPTKSDATKSPDLLHLGNRAPLTGGAAAATDNTTNAQSNQKKQPTNTRYTNDDDMLDQSEQYSNEEDLEPADSGLANLPPQPIVPSSRRPALENVDDDDDDYSEDMNSDLDDDEDLHGPAGLQGAGNTEKKKGSLSKYPIPSSFKEESRENSESGENKGKSRDNTQSAAKFKSPEQKKMMTANLNMQSEDDDEYSNEDFD